MEGLTLKESKKLYFNELIIHSVMQPNEPQYLHTKQDVMLFVCNKSVLLKKPFLISESELLRNSILCPQVGCESTMHFYQRLDGVFNLCLVRKHTCDAVRPTIRRVWVITKAKEILRERPKIAVSELRDCLKQRHEVDVDTMIVSLAIRDVKTDTLQGAVSL